jgi:hypothetical protein
MRFFSNDARESTDDRSAADEQGTHEQGTHDQAAHEQAREHGHDEQPDRVQSDPVAVPNQRPPSPWSNTPATTDAERRGDADAVADRDDVDAPPFHEPAPQPTAFGAATVGGAVSASAMANPLDDRDRTATSGTGTYAGSTADSAPDTVPATWTEGDSRDPDGVVDVPLDDKTDDRDANQDDSVTTYDDPDRTKADALKDDGTFDDPKVVDATVVEAPADSTASTVDDGDRSGTATTDTDAGPLRDDGGFEDPKVVNPVTEEPIGADSTPDAVVAAPVAAAAPAAAATAGPPDTLFDQDDAKSFQERWRDVQLRFVDSPKDATGDAAKLVDEAVEKLTDSLRAQRAGLHDDTEDTEQLRVQLRGYREILNRILSL